MNKKGTGILLIVLGLLAVALGIYAQSRMNGQLNVFKLKSFFEGGGWSDYNMWANIRTFSFVGGGTALVAGLILAAGGIKMPQPDAEAPEAAADSPIAQLERIADLRDRGVLSEEEFQAEKQRILKRNA